MGAENLAPTGIRSPDRPGDMLSSLRVSSSYKGHPQGRQGKNVYKGRQYQIERGIFLTTQ